MTSGPRTRIWFTPDRPHPRYNVRAAATWAGMRLARSADEADVLFAFEDVTVGPTLPPAPAHRPTINWGCVDISKSRVAAAFEQAFGYPLAVHPETWVGEAVEKSETNGAHDGRIVACPRPALPGRVYQRVVDAIDGAGMAVDLRTQCIGGRPVQAWIKARPASARFLPPNATARPASPDELFSREEQARLAGFLQLISADWCALDVLRDRDGRLYVVDVNKTDAGPITALPLRDKLAATATNARALRGLVGKVRRPARWRRARRLPSATQAA